MKFSKMILAPAKRLDLLPLVIIHLARPDECVASFAVGTDVGLTPAKGRDLLGTLGRTQVVDFVQDGC